MSKKQPQWNSVPLPPERLKKTGEAKPTYDVERGVQPKNVNMELTERRRRIENLRSATEMKDEFDD